MSEYQCYEFVALDRPLTSQEMAQLRAISTRADITPTRFWNEYHWGDLKADPAQLLARYFDAHFYFANWGSRRFMLRLPADRLNVSGLKAYFPGERARLTKVGRSVVLDLWSEDEEREDDEAWSSGGRLAALTPVRALLLQGDLSPAYVAWLGSVQAEAVGDTAREPPVPPGLANLAAPVASLVEVLRIDRDLLAAAAEASPAPSLDSSQLHAWLRARPSAEKDRWLLHAVEHPEEALGARLLAAFRKERSGGATGSRRTVAELRARAEQLRGERKAARAATRAPALTADARERAAHLERLAKRWTAAWKELDALISSSAYEEAATLAVDLREVAWCDGNGARFATRFEALKKTHARRRGFFTAFARHQGST